MWKLLWNYSPIMAVGYDKTAERRKRDEDGCAGYGKSSIWT